MTKVGKYELVRKLATGGMAEVFLAKFEWARGLEKTVVVKRILYHLAEDPSFIEMFFTEAQLAAQLSHPNIAQIIEFGESGGVYFLAMEYIDGPSLRSLAVAAHLEGTGIPFPHCARIAAFCCEALAHAHELTDPVTGKPLELVHRDVSPDNILISKTGSVKLVDFGIAKAATQNHHTKTGLVKGKLAYMAPEQLRAEPLDRRADIFSLGVMLYELAAGRKPFEATSEVTLIHAMLYEEMVPLRARRKDVPPELERIVNKALERNREDRWADCREMHAALEEYLLSTRQSVSALQIAHLVEKYRLTPGMTEGTPPQPLATPSRPHPLAKTPEPWCAERTPAEAVETAQLRQPRLRTGTDGSEAKVTDLQMPSVTPPPPALVTEVIPFSSPAAVPPPAALAGEGAPVPSPSPIPAPLAPKAIAPSKPAVRSRPWVAPAAAVLLLIFGAGVGLGLSRRNPPEQLPRSTKPEETKTGPIATPPTIPPTQPEQPPPPTILAKAPLQLSSQAETYQTTARPQPAARLAPPPASSLVPAKPSRKPTSLASPVATATTPTGPPRAAAKRFGKVTIRTRPESWVAVDDDIRRRHTPVLELALEEGRHTVTLECDRAEPGCQKVSQPTHAESFTVEADKTTPMIKWLFE